MTLYTLRGLTKVYGGRRVVDIPGLELTANKIYALLGPNGAGKTTLLNMLAFLDAPSGGLIVFRGRPVRFAESDLQPLRRQVVMVDQKPILFSTTVEKNIDFGLRIRGIDRRQRARLIDEALELVGMRKFAAAEAHNLSGGETQRVALARALALSPRVFLCDEPTANVDVENQSIIIDLLERINAEKKMTVVFTTHDRSQAAALADRTLALDNGRLVQAGYDNVFTATVASDIEGPPLLFIGPKLRLPVHSVQHFSSTSSVVKIAVDPKAIDIGEPDREAGADGSDLHEIVLVARENGGIRLVVDAGVQLTVRLEWEAYRRLKPLVGERVSLKMRPGAVRQL